MKVCSICKAVISRSRKKQRILIFVTTSRPSVQPNINNFKPKKELAQEKERSTLGSSGSNQLTLVELFVRSQPLVFDHPRAKEISKWIGKKIALDSEPLAVVDHTGFN